MSPGASRFASAASSDQGAVRPNNEDRVYSDDARGIFLVVDGMGGHEAGEHAADIAVERVRLRLERQTGSVEQRLREAITLANNAIYEAAQQNPEWKGMACVLTVAVIEDGSVTVGHVGDSRLYKIERGHIEKLTHDHSPVGEREDRGELSETEAMKHPRRNEVFRDVGSEERTPDDEDFIEILQLALNPSSALLLCSDGLSDAVSSANILKIVERNAGNRKSTVRSLISAANQTGKDNVSAIFIEGSEFARSFGKHAKGESSAYPLTSDNGTERFAARVRWYKKGAAYFVYGALIGAGLAYGVLAYLASQNSAHLPRTLVVTSPATIIKAMDQASAGDTVSVAPGTYTGLVRLKEGVDLVAQHTHESVIDGGVVADGIQHARLEGFQIRGGDAGVRINDSDVVLARDEIQDSAGSGVAFTGNSRGALYGCYIHNNVAGGIVVADGAVPAIENNVITSNGTRPDSLRPGLFLRTTLHALIVGNVFSGNGAEAIWAPAADDAMTGRNYFIPPPSGTPQPRLRIVPLGEGRP